MILVLSGTADGRRVVQELLDRGLPVMASAATPYGGQLLAGCGAEIITGRLSEGELAGLVVKRRIRLLVDATHPYACLVSETARRVCAQNNIPYLRYRRAETVLPEHPLIYRVDGYEEAARKAVSLGPTIFLTTGSKTLEIFLNEAHRHGCRVVARVLPEPEVIQHCRQLGLRPADIVAMQGPFSRELNRALLKQYAATVMVTKESGDAGGTGAKIEAALELGVSVVVIKRPPEPAAETSGTIAELLEKIKGIIITREECRE
ncbi:MAG: precorrin-6A reductase [Thermoanaerobacteraceae bacterium]|nr:precorrin-6A reductase [Thermoanaerobacteraceae bacterium]